MLCQLGQEKADPVQALGHVELGLPIRSVTITQDNPQLRHGGFTHRLVIYEGDRAPRRLTSRPKANEGSYG